MCGYADKTGYIHFGRTKKEAQSSAARADHETGDLSNFSQILTAEQIAARK